MDTTTPSHKTHGCRGGARGSAPLADVKLSAYLKESILDVRELAPAHRHRLIFEAFDALAPGQSFVLVNDHDPRPLYYQFSYEQEGKFTWAYEEQGPEAWRVRIGKTEGKSDAQA